MKKWKAPVFAGALLLLLTGCSSWMDGSYVSEERYTEQANRVDEGLTSVSSYQEICAAIADMADNIVERRTVFVTGIASDKLENTMALAVRQTMQNDPMAAYAVEGITYEVGTTGGKTAVVITIQYNSNRSEIQSIKTVRGMDAAKRRITEALNQVSDSIVLRISDYEEADYAQIVQDYAAERPDEVMELPQVAANVYPDHGSERVVELSFTYQTSRESLKSMQNYVQPVFSSAVLYVSSEEEQSVKYSRLYALLMETMDYTMETSITPAYSLLRHGVGDSKALSTVYGAMCRRAGLECQVVSGTRAGEPWCWNIIFEDGVYYHVDLARCYSTGHYQKMADGDMSGYVWDYAAYPVCGIVEETEEAQS